MKDSNPTILDELTLAVRGSVEGVARLSEYSEKIGEELYVIQKHLRKLLEFPNLFKAPEAEKLLRRIDRLIELRNMMELGSFRVTLERDLDALWQRIPK